MITPAVRAIDESVTAAGKSVANSDPAPECAYDVEDAHLSVPAPTIVEKLPAPLSRSSKNVVIGFCPGRQTGASGLKPATGWRFISTASVALRTSSQSAAAMFDVPIRLLHAWKSAL